MRESGVLPMNDRETILRYLLGQMSEPERNEVQERLFRDDEFFETVAEAETDLIDAYASGELTQAEREQMERSILRSPAARKRAEFAAALAGVEATTGTLPSNKLVMSRLRWIPVAAAVVLAIAAAALLVENRGLRNRIVALQSARPAQDSSRQQSMSPSAALPPVFTVLLEPGAVRGGGVPEIAIPPSSQLVELQLDLRGDVHESYQARLSAGAQKIWELSNIPAERKTAGAILPFWIPANMLSPGQYELVVTAGNNAPVEFYYFRVASR